MGRGRRFAELFAGAGGLSLGLERAGWECAFHAEIGAAPRAILARRWPDTPLYGDVVALSGGRKMKRWLQERYAGKIDLVSGGSPCQDLSVAGKRAGLDGARSSLFFRQMRLWKILGADLCLWENVDGARSSNNGKDFGAVLRAFVGADVPVPADGWRSAGVAAGPGGVAAWRVLDAQFFGVPQRRRRVFVLGTRTGSIDPAEVLSLAEGVCGDSQARGKAREEATGDAGKRPHGTLRSNHRNNSNPTTEARSLIFDWQNSPSMGMECRADASDALRTNTTPAVLAFNAKQDGSDADTIAPSLLAMPHHASHANGGGQLGVVAFDTTQITHPENRSNPQPGDPCHPLAAAGHAPTVVCLDAEGNSALDLSNTLTGHHSSHNRGAICLTGSVTHSLTHEGRDASEDGTGRGTPIVAFNETGHEKWTEEEIAGSLNAHEAREAHTIMQFSHRADSQSVVSHASIGTPRRLTPRECERLMSWPDDWTLVPDAKGKLLSDAARYKAIGNGVAAVHSQWIGERLALALPSLPGILT